MQDPNPPEKENKFTYLELLIELQKIIMGLSDENLDFSVQQILQKFESNYPYTFNHVICELIYFVFCSRKKEFDIYLKFLQLIQIKEDEINENIPKIITIFSNYISKMEKQEAYYIYNILIQQNLAKANILTIKRTNYFIHYHKNRKPKKFQRTEENFLENIEELSKNDFELHKQLIKEGHNPNEIAKIIRNDEIEKLQEISSQPKFDFNQIIEPSIYERCDFINKENVTLIDYAAYFGSVQCFKYLLMNDANVINTGKYAVAGGNLEIFHLCEQNHSSLKDVDKTAIKFHQNDLFKYLY